MKLADPTTETTTTTPPATTPPTTPATPAVTDPPPVPYQVFQQEIQKRNTLQTELDQMKAKMATVTELETRAATLETDLQKAKQSSQQMLALADGKVAPAYREYLLTRYQGTADAKPIAEWLTELKATETAFFEAASPTPAATTPTTETGTPAVTATPAATPPTSTTTGVIATPDAPSTAITAEQVREWKEQGVWEQHREEVLGARLAQR